MNIWARAPASAPKASSWGVDSAVERRLRRAVRREEWKKKYANSESQHWICSACR